MLKRSCLVLATSLLSLTFAALGSPSAAEPLPVIGEVRAYEAESPHPYMPGSDDRPIVWAQTVVSPGASFVRVHFSGFSLADGDFVTVSNPDRSQVWRHAAYGPHGDGEFWSFSVDGETAIVELHAGPASGYGYVIDALGHGTEQLIPPPAPSCSPFTIEPVACYANTPGFDEAQKSVARLDVVHGSTLRKCTGWLVDGSQPNMLMTSNECVSNQKHLRSLQAIFNYQQLVCVGNNPAPTSTFAGGTLLRQSKSSRIDYTLLTLQGNPELVWGELIPSAGRVGVGDRFWLFQHPSLEEYKSVGFWQDDAKTVRCNVNDLNATDEKYLATGARIVHRCLSWGYGTKGGPLVEDIPPYRVIGMHRGYSEPFDCTKSATAMWQICEDAGPLMNCQ